MSELKPCPFCGEVPTAFDTNTSGKWGFVQCCIAGPEVRTGYGPLEAWREDAIAEWNDRKPVAAAAPGADAWKEAYGEWVTKPLPPEHDLADIPAAMWAAFHGGWQARGAAAAPGPESQKPPAGGS